MKIILISHGSFSEGLAETVQMMAGEQEDLYAFGLCPEDSPECLEKKIEDVLSHCPGEEILIFTDLYFGSPFNVVNKLMGRYDLYHVTGINVPLLLEAVTLQRSGAAAEEICDRVVEAAGESVIDVRKQLLEILKEERE